MMKGTKTVMSTSKGNIADSSLVYPENALKCNSTSTGSTLKGKMRLQSITNTMIQEGGPKAWKTTGCSNLADGSVPNKTISHQLNCKGPNNPGEMYSVSEEAGESESEEQGDEKQPENLDCKEEKNQNKETEMDRVNKDVEEDEELTYMRYMCEEEMNEANEGETSRL